MNLLASFRYLVALDEHRHFGRAAQACHITQPALSNALRALEKEFGVLIVKRGQNYAGLTPEGERVLAAAQRMLREREALSQELASLEGQPVGRLRLGAVPTAMPIAARFAARLRARHPGIRPVVVSMTSSALEEGVQDLSLDLALGYIERLGANHARLSTQQQYTERYFLLRRSASRTAELRIGDPVEWREVAREPLCLLTPDMHNRQIVDDAFTQAGVAVEPAIETNSILTLALSVAAGDVCSVLPGALVAAVRGQGELEALPLTAPDVRTPIGFIRARSAQPTRAIEAALALAEDAGWRAHAAAHSGSLGR